MLENRKNKVFRCDYCECKDKPKNFAPCSTCSSNKNYVSHFHLNDAIKQLVNDGIVIIKEDNDGKYFCITNAGVCSRNVSGTGMEVQSEESDESESSDSYLLRGLTDGKDRSDEVDFDERFQQLQEAIKRNDSISATKSFS